MTVFHVCGEMRIGVRFSHIVTAPQHTEITMTANRTEAAMALLKEELLPEQWLWLNARHWMDRNILPPLLFYYWFIRRLLNPRFQP